jgi:dolichyl-phosphate beta-glucosyltransferase
MSYQVFEKWRDRHEARPALSIIIPTYNEAERILPTLGAMAVNVSALGYAWELIVSDDGSKDGTPDLVESLGWRNLRVLRHANTGKGGAVKRGMIAASGERILFCDADNSTPVEELVRLMLKLDEGFDVAIGSRAAAGATEQNKSLLRKLVSDTLRAIVRVGSGIGVRDTQCGFKLFTRKAAIKLFGLQIMSGFSFDLEILYLAHKFSFSVTEVPVEWFDAPGSKVNPVKDSLRFLRDLVQIRRNDRSGVYGKVI